MGEHEAELQALLTRLKEIEAAGPVVRNTRVYITDRLNELGKGGDKVAFDFDEVPQKKTDDKRGMLFDVEIDVDYDWSADKAPNPMDEMSMLKMRIEQALREEFPNGNYKLYITECDC